MRVLITNNTLAMRAGSELYVRDIALELLARGHEPIAYSRHLGEVARELRNASVVVVDDLSELTQPPDVIHAQHHLEAMTAITRYPNVPAIFMCHGWLPPQEAPPTHPRIYHYLAVDELVKSRLIDECGLASERVQLRLNFVDLSRFKQRPALPAKARRALAFSNYINDANVLPALQEGCKQVGIELDVLGASSGNAAERPEAIIGEYDIVFAKGRAALEAASVGAAVIVCDAAGIGEMLSSESLRRFRAYNFGLRLLRNKVTAEAVAKELGRYDAADINSVTETIRAEIGIDHAVNQLEVDYRTAIAAHNKIKQSTNDTLESELQSVSRYLRHGPLHSDFSKSEHADLNQRIAALRKQLNDSQFQARKFKQELASSLEIVNDVQTEKLGLQAELEQLKSELEHTIRSSTQKLAERGMANKVLRQELELMQSSMLWRIKTRLFGR